MKLPRHFVFNLWYLGRPPWDRGISPPELLEYIRNHPPGRAIDMGCGTATNVITLAKAGWQVTGVDFAGRAIRLARRKIRAAGVHARVQVGDVTHLSGIQGPFDLALDMGCFHGVEDKRAYLNELTRILSPHGSWLLYVFFNPHPDQVGPGVLQTDLTLIQEYMSLVWRQDSLDGRGRAAAWFQFEKR